MPNVPAQFPNIDLPGAEYFSLAPERTVALQGRRSGNLRIPATGFQGIPGANSGEIHANLVIEQPWTNTSGIYLHYIVGKFFPAAGDTSAELQIQGFSMGFGQNLANAVDVAYSVGSSPSILTTPSVGNTISSDRDLLITAQDITNAGEANTGVLVASAQIGVKNLDATNTHSFAIIISWVYTRLDGLLV